VNSGYLPLAVPLRRAAGFAQEECEERELVELSLLPLSFSGVGGCIDEHPAAEMEAIPKRPRNSTPRPSGAVIVMTPPISPPIPTGLSESGR
jgi:hypothetical protein